MTDETFDAPGVNSDAPSMAPKAMTADYWFRCPDCGEMGAIDDDQAEGRVSIVCPSCPFHETGKVTRKVLTTTPTKPEDAPTMEGRG